MGRLLQGCRSQAGWAREALIRGWRGGSGRFGGLKAAFCLAIGRGGSSWSGAFNRYFSGFFVARLELRGAPTPLLLILESIFK